MVGKQNTKAMPTYYLVESVAIKSQGNQDYLVHQSVKQPGGTFKS